VTRRERRAPLVLALLVTIALASPAAAGEPLGTNVFLGYSFAKLTELDRNGVTAAADFRLFGPVAGFLDASSHWGSDAGTSLNDTMLRGGPGVRFGKRGGTVIFARVLAGLVRDRASIQVLDVEISEGESRFGILAGGGIDFKLAKKLALRAQGDYLWNDVTSGKASGFRAAAGVVYRFGSAP
jgi:opacity protein-like surface antigen